MGMENLSLLMGVCSPGALTVNELPGVTYDP